MPVSAVSEAEAATSVVARPGELFEIERVPAALLVEDRCLGVVDPLAQELASLDGRERTEFDAGQGRRTLRPLERR